MKQLLKIAGIISLIWGVLLSVSVFGIIPGIINVVFGIILINYNKLSDVELKSKKDSILVFGIISMLTVNWLTAILCFVAHSKTNELSDNPNQLVTVNQPIKPPIDPEIRRLNILTQLGAFLIILSGIIFATSSWENLTGIIKVCLLLIISAIFYGLSIFMEKRLNIKNSAVVYYCLSLILTSFAYLCAGYFEIFGKYFSLFGDGNNLFIASTGIVISLLLLIAYFKYQYNAFIYSIYSVLTLVIIFVFNHFKIDYNIITLILLFISLGISLSKSNNNYFILLKQFNNVLMIILGLNLISILGYDIYANRFEFLSSDNFIYSSAILLIIFNGYYLALKEDNEIHQLATPFFITILIPMLLSFYKLDNTINTLIITTVGLFIYTFAFYIRKSALFTYSSLAFANILYFSAYSYSFDGYEWLPLLISTIVIIHNIYINLKDSDSFKKVELYLQPLKLMLLIGGIYFLLRDYISFMESKDLLIISGLVFTTIYLIQNNNQIKWIYYLVGLISSVSYYLFSSANNHWSFNLITVITFAMLFIISLDKIEPKYQKTNVPLLLLTALSIFTFFDLLSLDKSINNWLLFVPVVIYLYIAYLFRIQARSDYSNVLVLFCILPYYHFINNLNINHDYVKLLHFIGNSIFVVGFSRLFLSETTNRTKNIFEIVFILFLATNIIFINDAVIGLTLGVFGIIMILIGLYYKDLNSLFISGIIITLVNITVQLWELWSSINFGIYLFIAGLVLISIVTYLELKGKKPKEELVAAPIANMPIKQSAIALKIILLVVTLLLLTKYEASKHRQLIMVEEAQTIKANHQDYANLINQNKTIVNPNKVLFITDHYSEQKELSEVYVMEGYKFNRDDLYQRVLEVDPDFYEYRLIVLKKHNFLAFQKEPRYYYYAYGNNVLESKYYYNENEYYQKRTITYDDYIYTYYGLWEVEKNNNIDRGVEIKSTNDEYLTLKHQDKEPITYTLRLNSNYEEQFNIECYSQDQNIPLVPLTAGVYTVTFDQNNNYCTVKPKN